MVLHISCQYRANAVLAILVARNVLMMEVIAPSALLVIQLIIFPKTNSAKFASSKVALNARTEI